MTKVEYKEYLKTDYWKDIKEEVHKRDDYKCVQCGSKKNLHVHHKNYDNLEHEDLAELVTLCSSCHRETHVAFPYMGIDCYEKAGRLLEMAKEKIANDAVYGYFIENHPNIFDDILEHIKINNYIGLREFESMLVIHKDKKFDSKFTLYCLDYLDLILLCLYSDNIRNTYNFPRVPCVTKNLTVVTRPFYIEHKSEVSMMHRVYCIELLDIKTIFSE